MNAFIGCSGFYYNDWRKSFYPEEIPRKKWLQYYADQFNSVEINNTFYKIPAKKDMTTWVKNTPEDFRFICKGYRYITHMKKLNMDDSLIRSLHEFYEGIKPLEKKLAGILWQFPANFPHDPERIETFSKHLKKEIPNFFEFRKPVWYKKPTADLMDHLGLGLCTISAPGFHFDNIFKTNQWVYLRLHGKYRWYDYLYSPDELKEYIKQIRDSSPEQLFVFFNNDVGAQAPENARQMQKLIG